MKELCQGIVNVVIPLFTKWYAVCQLFLATQLEEKSCILPNIQGIMQRDELIKAEEMELLSIDTLTKLIVLQECLRADVAITQSFKGTTIKKIDYRNVKSVSTKTWEAIKQFVDDFTMAVENHDMSKITAPHHNLPAYCPNSTTTTHRAHPVATGLALATLEALKPPLADLLARMIKFLC